MKTAGCLFGNMSTDRQINTSDFTKGLLYGQFAQITSLFFNSISCSEFAAFDLSYKCLCCCYFWFTTEVALPAYLFNAAVFHNNTRPARLTATKELFIFLFFLFQSLLVR